MRKGKGPDPGGPKTCGSCRSGSGSATHWYPILKLSCDWEARWELSKSYHISLQRRFGPKLHQTASKCPWCTLHKIRYLFMFFNISFVQGRTSGHNCWSWKSPSFSILRSAGQRLLRCYFLQIDFSSLGSSSCVISTVLDVSLDWLAYLIGCLIEWLLNGFY